MARSKNIIEILIVSTYTLEAYAYKTVISEIKIPEYVFNITPYVIERIEENQKFKKYHLLILSFESLPKEIHKEALNLFKDFKGQIIVTGKSFESAIYDQGDISHINYSSIPQLKTHIKNVITNSIIQLKLNS